MCGKIDCYIKAFSELRTDKNKNSWSAATTFRAPHKPLLLLSILDQISKKKINKEFIAPSSDLNETYSSCWQLIIVVKSRGNIATPFYNMSREPFWNLIPRHGNNQPTGRIRSLKKLKEFYLGAKIDNELFKLCLMEPLRKRLRTTLINTYFAQDLHQKLEFQFRIKN
jgi:putative restriction endonuclease